MFVVGPRAKFKLGNRKTAMEFAFGVTINDMYPYNEVVGFQDPVAHPNENKPRLLVVLSDDGSQAMALRMFAQSPDAYDHNSLDSISQLQLDAVHGARSNCSRSATAFRIHSLPK